MLYFFDLFRCEMAELFKQRLFVYSRHDRLPFHRVQYNARPQRSMADTQSNTATMTYDAKSNLLASTEQSIAATTSFVYEPTFNQVTRITEPKGNQTNITYDVKGNPLTITDADNKVTTFTYDSRGLLLTSKDALNQTTTFTYDTQGRLLTTTDPLNRTTTLTYDNAGNVATSTDALNRITAFQYDQKNRLKKVIDPLLGETVYTYDGNGNLLTVKDAKNQITTFAYDDRNRLVSTTDPLGKVEAYEYDGNDNLTKRTTPKLDQIVFAYDPVNQLLSKTLPGSLVTSYSYSPVGNLLTVNDPDSNLTMTYDQANRLLTTATTGSSNQPAVTLTYTYDKNGNRLTAVDPSGTNTYAYDGLNRLTSLTSPVGATMLAYDALSRRTSLTLPNGTQTSYSYDVVSQVQSILHKITASNTPINNAGYLYNNVGNRTSLTDRRGNQTFGYDNLDRLTSATHPLPPTSQTFAYDAVGNRISNGSLSNAGNQLTEDAQFTYEYEANGNQTKKTSKTTNNFTVYSYDAENRLTQVQEFTAGNPTPVTTSSYRYDGLGRRIEKIGNGQTRRYVHDKEDILLEYDGANTLQARYTHGPGIDEPIAMTRGTSTYFYHADVLGSVSELTDNSAVVVKSYAYDSYGNILESPGTLDQPYTYTAREFDSESSLYNYRARAYDPRIGRFLQKDPIRFISAVNPYRFVHNNPLNLVDPNGDRPLTTKERDFLGNYFGKSLDTSNIDVDAAIGDRALSPYGDNIRLPNHYFKNGDPECEIDLSVLRYASVFAHEAAHVWQRQHGEWVTLKGFFLQLGDQLGISPYQYDAAETNPSTMLDNFKKGNVEQQGQIVEDFVGADRSGRNTSPFQGVRDYLRTR
jgi:RHS repeat-associated protein